MKNLIGKTKNGTEIYEIVDNEHMEAHKTVTTEILAEAISKMDVNSPFLMETVAFDREIGLSDLVSVAANDYVREKYRKGREGVTPICYNKEPQKTNLLTVGICLDDDNRYTVFTAFYGEKAPREPWDKNISSEQEQKESETFWRNHAICYNPDILDTERNETTKLRVFDSIFEEKDDFLSLHGEYDPQCEYYFPRALCLNDTSVTKLPDHLTVGVLSLEDTPIKELPKNLTVRGDLNLQGSLVEKLPDDIMVGGSLDLSYTSMKELPDNLNVGGDLNLAFTSISELPKGLVVHGNLNLMETSIEKLPEDMIVGGSIDLENAPIRELPDNLTVHGSLCLRDTLIEELPNNLSVSGDLSLGHTSIKELPDDLIFDGSLDLGNTSIAELPDNLSVRRNLWLNNTPITKLPDNLSVGGVLDLMDSPITELPGNLSVGNSLLLENTPIKKLPDNLTVGGHVYIDGEKIKLPKPQTKDLDAIFSDAKARCAAMNQDIGEDSSPTRTDDIEQ